MNPYFLVKEENQYELKIRGQLVTGTAEDLRKRLNKCVKMQTPIDPAAVASLKVEEELKASTDKCDLLTISVSEYDGDYTDTEGQRLLARLWHNYQRVGRIPVGTGDEKTKQFHDELLHRAESKRDLALAAVVGNRSLAMLDYKPNDPVVTQSLPSGVTSATATGQAGAWASPLCQITPCAPQTCIKGAPSSQEPSVRTKVLPVYKWSLQFDGHSQSVGAFLQRVEELRRARGVTTADLFESAVDLFTGPALTWYRSTIGRLSNWEELSKDMKLVFQHPDHDIYLHQEIFNRVQAETEPIDLFIAAMEGLYGRLSTKVSEDVKLNQILHNLHPQLQDRLALFDVQSLAQLRVMGRKAEAGRLRSISRHETSVNVDVLEPDLAYSTPPRRLPQSQTRATPERKVFQATDISNVTCFNCHMKDHMSRDCRNNREAHTTQRVCWRCHKTGHLQRDCRVRLNPTSPRSGNEAGVSGVTDTKPRQ